MSPPRVAVWRDPSPYVLATPLAAPAARDTSPPFRASEDPPRTSTLPPSPFCAYPADTDTDPPVGAGAPSSTSPVAAELPTVREMSPARPSDEEPVLRVKEPVVFRPAASPEATTTSPDLPSAAPPEETDTEPEFP